MIIFSLHCKQQSTESIKKELQETTKLIEFDERFEWYAGNVNACTSVVKFEAQSLKVANDVLKLDFEIIYDGDRECYALQSASTNPNLKRDFPLDLDATDDASKKQRVESSISNDVVVDLNSADHVTIQLVQDEFLFFFSTPATQSMLPGFVYFTLKSTDVSSKQLLDEESAMAYLVENIFKSESPTFTLSSQPHSLLDLLLVRNGTFSSDVLTKIKECKWTFEPIAPKTPVAVIPEFSLMHRLSSTCEEILGASISAATHLNSASSDGTSDERKLLMADVQRCMKISYKYGIHASVLLSQSFNAMLASYEILIKTRHDIRFCKLKFCHKDVIEVAINKFAGFVDIGHQLNCDSLTVSIVSVVPSDSHKLGDARIYGKMIEILVGYRCMKDCLPEAQLKTQLVFPLINTCLQCRGLSKSRLAPEYNIQGLGNSDVARYIDFAVFPCLAETVFPPVMFIEVSAVFVSDSGGHKDFEKVYNAMICSLMKYLGMILDEKQRAITEAQKLKIEKLRAFGCLVGASGYQFCMAYPHLVGTDSTSYRFEFVFICPRDEWRIDFSTEVPFGAKEDSKFISFAADTVSRLSFIASDLTLPSSATTNGSNPIGPEAFSLAAQSWSASMAIIPDDAQASSTLTVNDSWSRKLQFFKCFFKMADEYASSIPKEYSETQMEHPAFKLPNTEYTQSQSRSQKHGPTPNKTRVENLKFAKSVAATNSGEEAVFRLSKVTMKNEIAILQDLKLINHINICNLIKIEQTNIDRTIYHFPMLTELSDIMKWQSASPHQSLCVIIDLFSDILTALSVLKRLRIFHCDVSVSNILFDQGAKCFRLTDFGLSCYDTDEMRFPVGTDGFIAPEVRDNKFYYESDLFSLGCCIVRLTGYPRDYYTWIGVQNEIDTKSFVIFKRLSGLTGKCLDADKDARPDLKSAWADVKIMNNELACISTRPFDTEE